MNEKARTPEDLTRLFVERANAKDAAGLAELYEEDAVMAYPPGSQTVGRAAIRELWEKLLAGDGEVPAGAAPAYADKRRYRAYVDAAQGRRGRPRPGGAAAAGRQLATAA